MDKSIKQSSRSAYDVVTAADDVGIQTKVLIDALEQRVCDGNQDIEELFCLITMTATKIHELLAILAECTQCLHPMPKTET